MWNRRLTHRPGGSCRAFSLGRFSEGSGGRGQGTGEERLGRHADQDFLAKDFSVETGASGFRVIWLAASVGFGAHCDWSTLATGLAVPSPEVPRCSGLATTQSLGRANTSNCGDSPRAPDFGTDFHRQSPPFQDLLSVYTPSQRPPLITPHSTLSTDHNPYAPSHHTHTLPIAGKTRRPSVTITLRHPADSTSVLLHARNPPPRKTLPSPLTVFFI